MSVSGRYGFVNQNQITLSSSNAFTPIQRSEVFINKVLSWTSGDPLTQVKTLLIQFKVEKMVTHDLTDVSFLSIYRFPTLDSYKVAIKLAKVEAERVFNLKLLNTCFKPNKLQLLGVLNHLRNQPS